MLYNHQEIEKKWQKKWDDSGIYKDYSKRKKFYALDMFPYPSGVGLHVGHPKGYIATDVYSRFMMLNGYSVLHPMGWDAFGLPAENYAIENKIHPRLAVEQNITTFKKQLLKFGFTYDWDREINTTDPEYYKWTQWIFLKMFERGLAYQSDEPINWCPRCKTGLALEDLEGGYCERCGTQVVQKKMKQWVLKITDYADRLLYDLDSEGLDWEESIKEQQRNWIGRSEGAEMEFTIPCDCCPGKPQGKRIRCSEDKAIKVYTTRIDTIFGCTYCVVAPEHEIIEKLKDRIENYKEVEKYIIQAQNKTELGRMEMKEKTGVELKGIKAVNPFSAQGGSAPGGNNEEIPIFAADYVLSHYGTGAVMAVPAHDERDFEFAIKNNLPIKKVIVPLTRGIKGVKEIGEHNNLPIPPYQGGKITEAFIDDGALVNSGEFTGLTSEQAREEMTKWLEKNKLGEKKVNYKMRDWVFSRQRYWGEPMPIIYCEKCKKTVEEYKKHNSGAKEKFSIFNFQFSINEKEFNAGELLNPGWIAVPENELPLKLPDVESYQPTGTGEGPLANIKEWVNTTCPKCGGPAERETNTMPQWAGSSWYYLAYIMKENSTFDIRNSKILKEWLPVDLYVGGAEHATRHLLYARFWHKFLYDIRVVSTKEPFKRLIHVGLILAEDGRKMSKRWNNVINPDDIIEKFGADSIRLYEMFMGPFTQNIAWSTKGVVGMRRFLERVYKLSSKLKAQSSKPQLKAQNLLHKTIKKVTEDIESFRFNTAISQMMILVNELEKNPELENRNWKLVIILLSPFAPHLAEELWSKLGHKESIFKEKWPKYDENLIKDEIISLVVQVNGRVRDTIAAPADISEEEAKKMALLSEKVKKWIEGKKIKKIIYVRGRLVNIVI